MKPFLPRTLSQRLDGAGFNVELREVVPILNPCFDQDTYSNRLIDLIVSFVSGRCDISDDEAQTWADELRNNAGNGQYFFSLNRYLFLGVRRD